MLLINDLPLATQKKFWYKQMIIADKKELEYLKDKIKNHVGYLETLK